MQIISRASQVNIRKVLTFSVTEVDTVATSSIIMEHQWKQWFKDTVPLKPYSGPPLYRSSRESYNEQWKRAGGIDPADQVIAGPNFQNYNPRYWWSQNVAGYYGAIYIYTTSE